MYELPDDSDRSSGFAFLGALWAQRIRSASTTQALPDPEKPAPGPADKAADEFDAPRGRDIA